MVILVERLVGGNLLSLHLLCLKVASAIAVNCQHSAPVKRLYGFRPQPVLCAESYVAVVCSLSHWHTEAHAQTAYHVFLLVAVIYKGVHHSYLFAASIEVHSHYEW